MKKIVEVICFHITLLLALFIAGCTNVYRPVYTPTDIFYEDLHDTPVKLQVRDDRSVNKKIFYENFPIAIPENPKYQALTSTKLEPSSREIIEKSLRKAMGTSGYLISEDAQILMDVSVEEFIWRWNQYEQSFSADIKLIVTVKDDDIILIKRTIAETVERKPTIFHMGQDESMFSECLTKTVEKLISDYNIITAIRRGYQANSIE